MIKVTVWNENVQEQGLAALPQDKLEGLKADKERGQFLINFLEKSAREIKEVHPNGIHGTLKALLEEEEDFQVRMVTMDMPENGLPQIGRAHV